MSKPKTTFSVQRSPAKYGSAYFADVTLDGSIIRGTKTKGAPAMSELFRLALALALCAGFVLLLLLAHAGEETMTASFIETASRQQAAEVRHTARAEPATAAITASAPRRARNAR
ncbi:hypothetical protein dsx2_3018 [Desulfovibrio sp. X2]|nr:hypothetical protein dsx2_3018 [Desulfovibrio sp. X2]